MFSNDFMLARNLLARRIDTNNFIVTSHRGPTAWFMETLIAQLFLYEKV